MNIVRRGAASAALVLCLVPGAAAADPPEASKGPAPQAPQALLATDDDAKELSWEARRLEMDYRHRLARLHRLRELAEKRGDTQRVAEIDKLWHVAQHKHAERVNEGLMAKMDPEKRARLEEELAQGRDPQELVEFRRQMKEMVEAHRADMQAQREEFRDKMRDAEAEHRGGMQEKRAEFREDVKEKRAEYREDAKGKREAGREMRSGDDGPKPRVQGMDRRESVKDVDAQRGDDRRPVGKDRRDAQRDAARVAHERDWDETRDRAKSELAGKNREDVKRMAAGKMDDEARRSREDRWRRAASRDGLGPEGAESDRRTAAAMREGRFRMPSQQEANDLAGQDIDDDDADVEFDILRRELAP